MQINLIKWATCILVPLVLGLGIGLFFADRPQVDPTPPATSTTTHTVVTTPGPNGSSTVSTTITAKPCPPALKPNLSKYRLGLNYVRSFTGADKDTFELTGGIRLATTPVFLQGGFNPLLRQVTLGLSIEF
jgi:hypothetical protein